jgi:hypothetical protein
MGYFVKNRRLQSGSTGVVLPTGSTLDRPTDPVFGLIRYNTDQGQIEFFNGVIFQYLTSAASINYVVDNLGPGDGVTTTYTMSIAVSTPSSIIVFVGSLYQIPSVNYTVSGGYDITFTSAPPLGSTIDIVHTVV